MRALRGALLSDGTAEQVRQGDRVEMQQLSALREKDGGDAQGSDQKNGQEERCRM